MNREATISTDRVFSGRLINLRIDTVSLPNGHVARREIVEHPGAVALLPLDADGKLVLVRQYRKPAERLLLELPAGTLHRGEDPKLAAQRELQEEIGYSAGKLERLTGFYTCPGFCTEYMHVFLATDLRPSRLPADEDESLEPLHLSLDEALELMHKGEICDAKTIAGLLVFQLERARDSREGQ